VARALADDAKGWTASIGRQRHAVQVT